MQDLKVTLVQANLFWEDIPKNLDHFDHLLGQIIEQTDLILLPEMFNTGFSINPSVCAETMEGPSVQFLRLKAQEKNTVIMATLLIQEDGKFYNRLIAFYPDGNIASYDKRHLFRLSEEHKTFNRGEKQEIFEVKGWKILPIICYDLRFPVWSKNTWNNGIYGYDLMVCLANWPAIRSHVWKTLLVARALENQACVAGVNRIGHDGFGNWHSGNTMALNAKGAIAYAADEGVEVTGSATFSALDLKLFRDSHTLGMDWDHFTIDLNK